MTDETMNAPVTTDDLSALTPQLSIAVPAKTNFHLGRGHEEPSDMEDIEIPRATLVQYSSEMAQSSNASERIDPGTVINNITRKPLGEIFIPIFKFINYIRWNPRKKDDPNFDFAFDPGELIFLTNDPTDPRVVDGKHFGPNGELPKVTKYLNFLSYFPGHEYPLILSFSKTSLGSGKKLNSMTLFEGGDMFEHKYKLSVIQKDNAGTKYFLFDVTPLGKVSPDEFVKAESWYKLYRGLILDIATKSSLNSPVWVE